MVPVTGWCWAPAGRVLQRTGKEHRHFYIGEEFSFPNGSKWPLRWHQHPLRATDKRCAPAPASAGTCSHLCSWGARGEGGWAGWLVSGNGTVKAVPVLIWSSTGLVPCRWKSVFCDLWFLKTLICRGHPYSLHILEKYMLYFKYC